MDTVAPLLITDRIWTPPTDRSRELMRSAVLVVGFALFTAALAQFEVHLAFSPVPITGQTLGVLLAGGALGSTRGAASMSLYWVLGLIGLPFYSGGAGGWTAGTGSTLGYLVGFIVAAWVVGRLAERDGHRTITSSLPAMLIGSVVIYAFGAVWLSIDIPNLPLFGSDPSAMSLGVTPFLAGDAIKLVMATVLLPASWVLSGD